MGKAICIGLLIIFVIVGTFAGRETITNEHDKAVQASCVFMFCILVIVGILIFGGIGCF